MTIDERISSELRRHAPEVDERAAWERIQSAAPARHRVWARRWVPITVAAIGVVVLGIALVRSFPWDPAPVAALESPFRGTWFSTDDDGSAVTMTVEVSGDGVVEIDVVDDSAHVCAGAAATISGTGRLESDTEMVIPTPVLTCDDGTEPLAQDGVPMEDIIRDLTFTHDPENDSLTDSLLSTWSRERAEDPNPDPTVVSGMWPQTSQEEVEEAQELADAGDPGVTWQLDPEIANGNSTTPEIVARFLREQLGWEEFLFNPFVGWDAAESNLYYLRCAPDEVNPMYPDDDLGGRCSPTIDDLRYETVIVDLAQPVRSEPSGIWVVARWTTGGEFSQVVPPTAEAAALVEDFLQARIAGVGAEQYVDGTEGDVPLLYTTNAGEPYESFEFEQVGGPQWPFGVMEFEVRLFAGETVVEQRFHTTHEGRLGLEYRAGGDVAPTTENGQPLAVPDDLLHDGQVIMYAPYPWRHTFMNDHALIRSQGSTYDEIQVIADPRPVGTGCEAGPAQADAQALAESIQSDPDFDATAPVSMSIGGVDALMMEVEAAAGASVCDYFPGSLVLGSSTDQLPGDMHLPAGSRMRLYLLDLPEGMSARILGVAVIAPAERFESVVEDATPILESMELNGG